jgi:hypothetical protein
VHRFINTLDMTPINWYLQAELRLVTTDWEGMIQNFVTTFFFESEYPSVGQALQILRQKVFEATSSLPMEQEEDEWTAPLQKLQSCYNINADDDDNPRKVNITETEGQREWKDQELSYHLLANPSRSKRSTLGHRRHRSLPMLEITGMLPPLTRLQNCCTNIRTCFRPSSLI